MLSDTYWWLLAKGRDMAAMVPVVLRHVWRSPHTVSAVWATKRFATDTRLSERRIRRAIQTLRKESGRSASVPSLQYAGMVGSRLRSSVQCPHCGGAGCLVTEHGSLHMISKCDHCSGRGHLHQDY